MCGRTQLVIIEKCEGGQSKFHIISWQSECRISQIWNFLHLQRTEILLKMSLATWSAEGKRIRPSRQIVQNCFLLALHCKNQVTELDWITLFTSNIICSYWAKMSVCNKLQSFEIESKLKKATGKDHQEKELLPSLVKTLLTRAISID